MNRSSRLLACLCVLGSAIHAREQLRWTSATVLHAQYTSDSTLGVTDSRGTVVARGEFDFDAGEVVYTAEEWVAPNRKLRLSQGDSVRIAIDKKNVMLELEGKEVRKLKLLSTHPKRNSKSNSSR